MKFFGITKFNISFFAFILYFLLSFVLYKVGVNKLYIQSEDTLPAMFFPVTVLKDKTVYLDNYYQMMIHAYPQPDDKTFAKGLTPFYVKKVLQNDGSIRYISAFPLISGLLAFPVYAIPILAGMQITWFNLAVLSHLTSAIVVASSGYFFFSLLKKHFSLSDIESGLITCVYLFATINFSLVSQGLWQHGPVELFTILGLSAFFDKKYFQSGAYLGLAVLSRPTALLSYGFIFLFFLYKQYFVDKKFDFVGVSKYVLGLLPSVLFFAFYTQVYYQGIQNNGYADQIITEWRSNILEGFFGLWVSPSKGLLIYSPIFIFSILGAYYAAIKVKLDKSFAKYICFSFVVLVHTLVLGKWKHWYGGWSFGYRMAADIIPYLVLLLVPFIKSEYYSKYKYIFYTLLIISVIIQLYGLVFFDGIWHAAYDRGYEQTAWLWSLKDSEFAFDFRRILVKIGLLDKACPQC